MTSLAGLPTLNQSKAEAQPPKDLEVPEEIDENSYEDDFERDDALTSSAMINSTSKPGRTAEAGSNSKQAVSQAAAGRPTSYEELVDIADNLDATEAQAQKQADGQKLPEDGLF